VSNEKEDNMADYKWEVVDNATYWANNTDDRPERVTYTKDGEEIFELGAYPVTLPTGIGAVVMPPSEGYPGYNGYVYGGDHQWHELCPDEEQCVAPESEVQEYLDKGWKVAYAGK
jgi:hypothetical protein